MGIQAVKRAVLQLVLNDHIAAVIAMGGVGGGMDYRASGYGVHVVQRPARSIPPERFNVDTLMKFDGYGACLGSDEGPGKAVGSSFPRLGFLPFKIAVYIHVKVLRAVVQQGCIFRGEAHYNIRHQEWHAPKKQEDAGQERKGFAVHADTRGAGSDPPPAGADHGTVFVFFRVFGLLLFLSRVLAGKKRLGNGGQFVDGFFSLGIRRGNKFRHGGKIRRGEPSHDCQFS